MERLIGNTVIISTTQQIIEQQAGFVRKTPIFSPVCLLYSACSGQSLSSRSGTKYTHTHPFPKIKAQALQDRVGICRGPTTQWGPPHRSSHSTPQALLSQGFDSSGPLAPPLQLSGLLPQLGRELSLASASLLLSWESENPERTSPAPRRMLRGEQVQLASRKLQRYTGGGGRGGSSGQRDLLTASSGLLLPR